MKTLKTLFLDELADRYDGEKQLVEAMPSMLAATTCNHLKKLLQFHLKQSTGQVARLENLFKSLGEKPHSKECLGIYGLLNECNEITAAYKGSHAINAALVSCAQKIAHYEIASLGCLQEWAADLEKTEAANILQNMLDEENASNHALTELARSYSNKQALNTESLLDSRDNKSTSVAI